MEPQFFRNIFSLKLGNKIKLNNFPKKQKRGWTRRNADFDERHDPQEIQNTLTKLVILTPTDL